MHEQTVWFQNIETFKGTSWKGILLQKLFWPFKVWINKSSDLKIFANSRPSTSNFKSFFLSLEQIFLTVGQNNFGNKIPFPDKVDPASLLCSFSIQTNIYRKVLMGWILVWSNRLENRFKPHRLVFFQYTHLYCKRTHKYMYKNLFDL